MVKKAMTVNMSLANSLLNKFVFPQDRYKDFVFPETVIVERWFKINYGILDYYNFLTDFDFFNLVMQYSAKDYIADSTCIYADPDDHYKFLWNVHRAEKSARMCHAILKTKDGIKLPFSTVVEKQGEWYRAISRFDAKPLVAGRNLPIRLNTTRFIPAPSSMQEINGLVVYSGKREPTVVFDADRPCFQLLNLPSFLELNSITDAYMKPDDFVLFGLIDKANPQVYIQRPLVLKDRAGNPVPVIRHGVYSKQLDITLETMYFNVNNSFAILDEYGYSAKQVVG